MTTPPKTMIAALQVLARDIQSEDGVPNACIADAAQMIEEMNATEMDLREENTRLRAALAQLPGACHYCQLPKDQWSLCKSGFPGCNRADDAMGCPEFGAMMEYGILRDRCAEVVRAWENTDDSVVDKAIKELATEIKYKGDAK